MSEKSQRFPTVATLMRRHFIAVSAADSLADVGRIMHSARVRGLPVTHDQTVVGVISFRDIFEVYREALSLRPEEACIRIQEIGRLPVEQAMKPASEVIQPTAGVEDAAHLLCETQTGFLPVVEPAPQGLRMLGIITESDLLRAAYDPVSSGG